MCFSIFTKSIWNDYLVNITKLKGKAHVKAQV